MTRRSRSTSDLNPGVMASLRKPLPNSNDAIPGFSHPVTTGESIPEPSAEGTGRSSTAHAREPDSHSSAHSPLTTTEPLRSQCNQRGPLLGSTGSRVCESRHSKISEAAMNESVSAAQVRRLPAKLHMGQAVAEAYGDEPVTKKHEDADGERGKNALATLAAAEFSARARKGREKGLGRGW